MGMVMASILGNKRKKTQATSRVDTPPCTTRSAKDITLAIKRINVNTSRFTMKVGMVSERILRLIIVENIKYKSLRNVTDGKLKKYTLFTGLLSNNNTLMTKYLKIKKHTKK
jgi:hypothetical protein